MDLLYFCLLHERPDIMRSKPAARQNFDQVVQGVFAGVATQMSAAGRHALADWPPGRKSQIKQQ